MISLDKINTVDVFFWLWLEQNQACSYRVILLHVVVVGVVDDAARGDQAAQSRHH